MLTETEKTPVFVPEAEAILSQGDGLVTAAVQFSVPPPVFETVSDCAAGLEPPCCALNVNEVGVTPMTGGAAVMVSVTLMVCGELLAPVAEIWIDPE